MPISVFLSIDIMHIGELFQMFVYSSDIHSYLIAYFFRGNAGIHHHSR